MRCSKEGLRKNIYSGHVKGTAPATFEPVPKFVRNYSSDECKSRGVTCGKRVHWAEQHVQGDFYFFDFLGVRMVTLAGVATEEG